MMWKKYQSIPLIYKMIAGMLAGIFAGWLMGAGAELFAPLGKFFHAACHRKPHCGNLKPR